MTTIALIDAHPDPDPARYVHALAHAYADGAAAAGHKVHRIDLAALDFPLLRSRAEWMDAPPPAIAEAQAVIRDAGHLAILFPLWLGDMPALLKGFLEQIARPGFAIAEGTMPRPLLKGRSARVVVTMGMPAIFYRFYYGAHSVRNLERNILNLAGIRPVRNSLVGMVEGSARARTRWLDRMARYGARAR